MFNVIDMLPVQLKHNHETHGIETKIGVKYVKDNTINEDECILLVGENHVIGETANIAVQMIREKFGKYVKIIYVSLTREIIHIKIVWKIYVLLVGQWLPMKQKNFQRKNVMN